MSIFADQLTHEMDRPVVPHTEVRALAGCGKTSTAVEGMKSVKGLKPSITPSQQQEAIWHAMAQGRTDTIRFLAYNTDIAAEIKTRLTESGLDSRGCEGSTVHSLGLQCLRRSFPTLDWSKDADRQRSAKLLAAHLRTDLDRLYRTREDLASSVSEVVSLCKQTLTDPREEGIDRLVGYYGVDLGNESLDDVQEAVEAVYEASLDPANGTIDFDDMPWLPIVLNLPVPKRDIAIADEGQDLSVTRQELLKRAGHRIIWLGDENQAVYGFSGASPEAMTELYDSLDRTEASCESYPLTVTRRCGHAIVREANKYVPDFEAHQDNPDGEVEYDHYPISRKDGGVRALEWREHYGSRVLPGDMVLCRANAPLINHCFAFLRRGIPANVAGKDIGRGLSALVKRLRPKGLNDLVTKLNRWKERGITKERGREKPSYTTIATIRDKAEAVTALAKNTTSIDQLKEALATMFADSARGSCVWLSTVHKAKGLEADTVWFLRPEDGELDTGRMQPWEAVQYRNLSYIAITRARKRLVYVV